MAYIAPRSVEEPGRVDEDILAKIGSRKGMGRLKIKSQLATPHSGSPICSQPRVRLRRTPRLFQPDFINQNLATIIFVNFDVGLSGLTSIRQLPVPFPLPLFTPIQT